MLRSAASPCQVAAHTVKQMAELIKVDQARLGFLLEYAVRIIISGKVVAFPTDTFYGLGADPFNLAAVSEVFRIKRRTADRPLPLLVASIDQAADLTHDPPQLFFTLAKKFWPGPLTLVVPASRQIPLKVTANTGNVGLRWPQALLATASGFLHADAYAGFDKLYEPDAKTGRPRLLPVACRVGGEVTSPAPHRPGRAD